MPAEAGPGLIGLAAPGAAGRAVGTDRPWREQTWLTSKPHTVVLAVGGLLAAVLAGAVGTVDLKMGVALIAGLALTIAVLVRPFVGAVVLAGVAPVVSGFAPGLPVPYLRLSEVLIGVVGVTLIASARREDTVPWGALDWLLLGYGAAWAFCGTFDALAQHEHLTLSDWGTVFGQLQFFLVYRGVRLGLRNRAERRAALVVVLVASVPVAALAVLQQLHAPGISSMLNTLTGTSAAVASSEPLLRAGSIFVNWASLAGYLFPILLVMIALALGGLVPRRRRAAIAVAALAIVALVLTAELSAICCLLACAVLLGTLYGQGRRIVRVLAVALLLGAVVVGPFLANRLDDELSRSAGSSRSAGVPQTLQYRTEVWTDQYLPAIGAQPLTGYGVVLPSSIQWPYPESQYIALLIDGGIPLLLVFCWLMWAMIDQTRRWSRADDPFDAALARALFVTVVALVAMDVIWPYLSNAGLPQVLWALFAIAAPIQRGGSEAAPPEAAPPLVGMAPPQGVAP